MGRASFKRKINKHLLLERNEPFYWHRLIISAPREIGKNQHQFKAHLIERELNTCLGNWVGRPKSEGRAGVVVQ